MKFWLFKTEPDVFSIDDLEREKVSFWEGVRNYQARNYLRDEVKLGDLILFYHSSTQPTGIVGIAEVVGEGEPDPHQFNAKSPYYDEKADPNKPRWFGVRIKLKHRFKEILTLETLRNEAKLKDMLLLKRGMRLSIQPVSDREFQRINELGLR
ncbi:EVE domain protein [Leptospira ryugenii]|uniref:EVE domain protein n=1 Tax=Leptospira ryugenii TaxID=1917863 RepID=A0A2P2E2K3_9LEPT|nr:EVE domain-containing protein [Leptospira ryugenii]GBF51133.1 EVE domain protein [Leptospira ryugenii]